MKLKNALYVLGTAGAMNFQVAPAGAQSVRAGLEEIIVTAQRREENLQSTPVSVAAFGSEQLRDMNATSVANLSTFVPNFSMGNATGRSTDKATLSIRGVNEALASITTSPAVGIYIDDVYYGQPQISFLKLMDVERLEVLRGPQGTLFGKNSNGGAVRYISKQPTLGQVEGYVAASLGNYNQADLSGAINLPIGDNLAVRIKAGSLSRDGYVDRLADNRALGAENAKFAGAQLLWKPSDRVTVNVGVDHTLRDTDVGPLKLIDYYRFNGSADASPPLLSPGAAWSAAWNLQWGNSPRAFRPQIPASLYEVAGTGRVPRLRSESTGLTLNMAFDLTDAITLKSITGYRKVEEYRVQDLDDQANAYVSFDSDTQEGTRFWSEELQLSGSGDRLNWTAGLYYAEDKPTSSESFSRDARASGAFGAMGLLNFADFEVKSTGIFAQGTFNLTDKFSVTAGLRWSQDDQSFKARELAVWDYALVAEAAQLGLAPITPPASLRCNILLTGSCYSVPEAGTTSKHSATTPRLSFEYQWTDDFMTYLSGSEGFKSGGPNDSATDMGIAFTPEKVRSYEFGIRTEFLDKRARINATYFFMDYFDKQITVAPTTAVAGFVNPCVGRCILNAGDAEISGVEIETLFAVTDRFQLHANLATLDAKWVKVAPGSGVSLASDFALAPKLSYAVGGEYSLPMAGGSALTFSADYAYKDDQETSPQNDTTLTVPAYGLLQGRLKYESSGGAWDASLYCSNCLDKEYITGGNAWAGTTANTIYPYKPLDHNAFVYGGIAPNLVVVPDLSYVIVGAPRMFGVDFRYKF